MGKNKPIISMPIASVNRDTIFPNTRGSWETIVDIAKEMFDLKDQRVIVGDVIYDNMLEGPEVKKGQLLLGAGGEEWEVTHFQVVWDNLEALFHERPLFDPFTGLTSGKGSGPAVRVVIVPTNLRRHSDKLDLFTPDSLAYWDDLTVEGLHRDVKNLFGDKVEVICDYLGDIINIDTIENELKLAERVPADEKLFVTIDPDKSIVFYNEAGKVVKLRLHLLQAIINNNDLRNFFYFKRVKSFKEVTSGN